MNYKIELYIDGQIHGFFCRHEADDVHTEITILADYESLTIWFE